MYIGKMVHIYYDTKCQGPIFSNASTPEVGMPVMLLLMVGKTKKFKGDMIFSGMIFIQI
jgi:hypothetical protein